MRARRAAGDALAGRRRMGARRGTRRDTAPSGTAWRAAEVAARQVLCSMVILEPGAAVSDGGAMGDARLQSRAARRGVQRRLGPQLAGCLGGCDDQFGIAAWSRSSRASRWRAASRPAPAARQLVVCSSPSVATVVQFDPSTARACAQAPPKQYPPHRSTAGRAPCLHASATRAAESACEVAFATLAMASPRQDCRTSTLCTPCCSWYIDALLN